MTLSGLLTSTVVAAGAVATNFTDHFEETISFPTTDSCQGEAPVIATVTQRGVVHVTELTNGTIHISGTLVGSFTYVPLDSTLATTTGKIRIDSFHFNGNLRNGVFNETFIAAGTVGDDPSAHRAFHEVIHMTVVPESGEVSVSFDRISIQCP
jgi:hypothetical protein